MLGAENCQNTGCSNDSAPQESGMEYPKDNFSQDYFNHPDNQFSVDSGGGRHRKITTVLIVVAAAALGIIILQLIFHVRDISVVGAQKLTPEEVIELSGVREGQSTFLVNHDKVRQNIQANRYIKPVDVEVHLPGTVIIKIREREPRAYVCHNGFYIIIDNEGVILEEYANETASMSRLVKIEGLSFTYPEIGTTLKVRNSEAMLGVREILVEIAVKKLQGIICEVNVSDPENIFLATAEGFSVRMGDGKRIHAKLEATKQMRIALLSQGVAGEGTIDVSTPETPVYIPVTHISNDE